MRCRGLIAHEAVGVLVNERTTMRLFVRKQRCVPSDMVLVFSILVYHTAGHWIRFGMSWPPHVSNRAH